VRKTLLTLERCSGPSSGSVGRVAGRQGCEKEELPRAGSQASPQRLLGTGPMTDGIFCFLEGSLK
jgi:hypothetical protein